MEIGAVIFGLILSSIILNFVLIKISRLYLNNDTIQETIVEYYESKGYIVNDIYELNFTERLKYGVPLIPLFRLYSFYFGFMSGKIDYVRKVDVIDKKDNEYTKFIELQVQRQKIISLKEFE